MLMKSKSVSDFSKEETERIKRITGVDEFYPTPFEVDRAVQIFKDTLEARSSDIKTGINSKETVIKLAIVAVWKQARIYQHKKESI